ncbi:MAG: hypothetical protein HZB43_13350 [candidate division Zixibacteria bacterium]|nr:hypothetical protein [candidate division Zixibacteria bacterium]
MHTINMRMVILRLVIFGILCALAYPFMPVKFQLQIRAALGSGTAEEQLKEYYGPPDQVPDARQFAMERQFAVTDGERQVVTTNDVRYVTERTLPGGMGKLWEIHLLPDGAHAIQRHLKNRPNKQLWIVLDEMKVKPAPQNDWGKGSPILVDPASFSDDPYFSMEALQPWYERPFMAPGAMAYPRSLPIPSDL